MSRPLRIFLACQQAQRRHAVPAYAFWAEYFRGAFAEAGHVCLEAPACDWAEGLLPLEPADAAAWRQRTWESALAYLRREHAREPIDFFLGYLFPQQVEPAALESIRALGIPCVNFFCDNVRELRAVPAAYRGFDLHWVPEHKALPLYRAAGLPHLPAPMPCWVPSARRAATGRETLPVTFVGTRDAQREALFAGAIRLGLAVDLRGVGWEGSAPPPAPAPQSARDPRELARRQFAYARQHGWAALWRKLTGSGQPRPVDFDFKPFARPAPVGDDYWTVLRESTVCIGVNRYPSLRFPFDRPDTYSRLRDLEGPMVGACYLTEWTEGLDELYSLGTEIETYRDAAELTAKAAELHGDAPRRARMRAAAQRRALNHHSIDRTLQRIAARLSVPGYRATAATPA